MFPQLIIHNVGKIFVLGQLSSLGRVMKKLGCISVFQTGSLLYSCLLNKLQLFRGGFGVGFREIFQLS